MGRLLVFERAIFAVAFVLSPELRADVVFLKNGSMVEGTISIETPGFVVIDLAGAGKTRIEKRNIAEVMHEKPRPTEEEVAGDEKPADGPALDGADSSTAESEGETPATVAVPESSPAEAATTERSEDVAPAEPEESEPAVISASDRQLLEALTQVLSEQETEQETLADDAFGELGDSLSDQYLRAAIEAAKNTQQMTERSVSLLEIAGQQTDAETQAAIDLLEKSLSDLQALQSAAQE